MERSYFRSVKEAFATSHETSLQYLGVELKKGGNAEWQTVKCPCCTDTDGSASIAKASGHLRCHQCGRTLDLFEWWAEIHGCTTWDAAKQIGDALKVPLPTFKKGKGREVQKMTATRLDRAIIALLESPEASLAREFLKKRGLFEPTILAQLGVGFMDGHLIFAQFHPNGELRERYRKYAPLAKQKWMWSKGSGAPVGFWPYYELAEDAEILLCEGEMDVLTALIKYKLHKRRIPIMPATWTGGAGSPIVASMMPQWAGRKVQVCYDNDVFQGPSISTHRAPTERQLRDLMRRRENLVRGVAGKLDAAGCQVELLAVPINPVDNFGADLRDWAEEGKEFDDIPKWKLSDLRDPEEAPEEVTHARVFTSADRFIRTHGCVATIEENTLSVPGESRIICPMGTKPCCGQCRVPKDFADQFIDYKLHRADLLAAMMSKDPDAHIIKNTLCKPAGCNECKLHHEVYTNGSWWTCSPSTNEEGDGTEVFHVVSTERPSLSGDVGITGYALHTGKSVGILATSIEQLDKPEIDIDRYHNDLIQMTPWSCTDLESIDAHLEKMVHDYTHNITQIYGRPELHIATLLVAHSVIRFDMGGHKLRGWLDACTFGDTRQGKSETIKRIMQHLQLGTAFTCMENFSRAGLTVGGAESGSRMKPGLWPKNNRKWLFLDEFHHMSSGGKSQNVMVHLQSARDEGMVSALKVYGDIKLPAACRLITAGNWSNRNRRHFQYACQHLLQFYGVPESLSRLDFAWAVYGTVRMVPEDVAHEWTTDFARALVLRSWAMEPHQVHIDPEAIELAKQVCREWDEIYAADELPLHTGIEKHHSIIRIAIAIANICYSHPDGRPNECQVRVCHVKWAIAWILKCWENLQYDLYSQRIMAGKTVKQPFLVEAGFTLQLGLDDPDHAIVILSRLSESNNLRSMMGFIMGNGQIEEPRHFNKWLGMMQRRCALVERTENAFNVMYVPTDGAAKILRHLVNLARANPREYAERYKTLANWFSNTNPEQSSPMGLEPLDSSEPEEFYDVPF